MKAKLSAFGFLLYSDNQEVLAYILLEMSSEETTNHWIEQGCPDVVNR